MIKRSSSGGGESVSAARKHQATSAPLDDEDPLVPSSTPEHDASSVASMIPVNLIATLILPYVQNRATWNNVCCASKELYLAGKEMTPPWPNAILNVGAAGDVTAVAFSPCESFLACSIAGHTVAHVWDRHAGKHAQLEGHTAGSITCLQYSLDGKYLASGIHDRTIRLWRITTSESAHSSSSDESRNQGMIRGTPQVQSDITLLGGHRSTISALAFSPTDSNLLASGYSLGEIKLWNVINQVCIHALDPGRYTRIDTIFFSPGAAIQCYVVTMWDKMIRIVRNDRMEFAATILDDASLPANYRAVFSPCGTCFAAISCMSNFSGWELALFDLRNMVKTQSVVLPQAGCDPFGSMVMSPDGKKLAITNKTGGGIRLFECRDLNIQEYFIEQRQYDALAFVRWPVSFHPTNKFFAVGCGNGRVEIRTIS
jgi:WD40 repeat protein